MRKLTLLLSTLCCVTVLPLSAGPILIFNTGVLDSLTQFVGGGPLNQAASASGASDPHWICSMNCTGNAVTAVGATPAQSAASGVPTGWPVPATQFSPNPGAGPWIGSAGCVTASATCASQWISSQANVDAITPGGLEYDFTQTFTIGAGLVGSTASLAGSFAADNFINGIMINGNVVNGFPAGIGTSGVKVAFTITNSSCTPNCGFGNGANTIQFRVQNSPGGAPNPSGLLVEFTSATAADVSAVPEPATLFGVGLGLSLLGLVYRRRS